MHAHPLEERRFERVDRRFDSMDRRLDGFDCRFNWLTGIVVGTWITTMRVRASAVLSEAQDAESKGHDDTEI
jgi:hypothetical protein